MTITKDDIKLLASERLTDDDDGGGFMTGTVITDGLENNLFPDISEVDRAMGAVDYRKFYGAVVSDDTDTYYGAHLILDVLPSDSAVSPLLRAASSGAQTRSALISTLNSQASADTDQSGGPGWYSLKPLAAAMALGDRVAYIDGVSAQLVPVTAIESAVSGALSTGEGATVRALVVAGTSRSVTINGSAQVTLDAYVVPGTLTGTIGASAISDDYVDGVPSVLIGATRFNSLPTTDPVGRKNLGAGYSTASATYQPAAVIRLPRETHSFVWTTAMSAAMTFSLPHLPERGTETITWESNLGTHRLDNCGAAQFLTITTGGAAAQGSTANVDRASGQIVALFNPVPKVGTLVTVTYGRAGYARALAASCLSGAFSAGVVGVTPSSGWAIKAATFKVGAQAYQLDVAAGTIVTWPSGVVAGAYSLGAGQIIMPSIADGATITDWCAVELSNATPTTSTAGATIEAGLLPATVTVTGSKSAGGTFTATADATGVFATALVSGSYNTFTGALTLAFAEAVVAGSVEYEGTLQEYTPVSAAVAGVDPGQFPISGKVQCFREGDLVVIHHTVDHAPQTVTNGQTVSLGRTAVSDVRVFGSTGAEISTGFVVNRAAGTVTFGSVAGYSQPITIRDRVQDLVTLTSVEVTGRLGLSRGVTRAYASGTTLVSSAVLLGDLQARVHLGFQQSSWTNVWSDAPIGTVPLADFDEVNHPIAVSNAGAVKDRWAIIFYNTGLYNVIGEERGVVATGSTSADCAPINPATGAPYFTIPALGWGTGWAIGYVYRFNTDAAAVPAWVIRSISPSDPIDTQDRTSITLRGSINA